MDKEREKARIEKTINEWIARIDQLVEGVKAIKNYREDTLCVDYHRSLMKARSEYFNMMLEVDRYADEQIKENRFDKIEAEQDKRYAGLADTLKWLQKRPRIIKWD